MQKRTLADAALALEVDQRAPVAHEDRVRRERLDAAIEALFTGFLDAHRRDPDAQTCAARTLDGTRESDHFHPVELDLADSAVDRRLDSVAPPTWRPGASVTVVMASEGYPGEITRSGPIRGLAAAGREGVQVFHAATKLVDGQVVSAGGRVLAVTATGASLGKAKLAAYSAVKEIRWDGAWCRKDIADKGLARERELLAALPADDAAAAEGATP